jgi:plastocyanin
MDGLLKNGVLALGLALFVMTTPAVAGESVVDQHDLMFAPGAITIAVGDTVRFTDSDRITHNITIVYPDGSTVDKGMDRYGEDIIVHFTKTGTYQVRCLIHPMMHMTITVK